MRLALALLLLPALLAGCFAGEPAARPLPTGQIDGAVVDHLLTPFGNQTVTLVQLGRTDQTSALGGFTFRQVPPGFYTVTTTRGEATDAQVVDVQAGRVSRLILQLLPIPQPEPFFEAYSFDSRGERPVAGEACDTCEWALPLGGDRPAEAILEALWHRPFLGDDGLLGDEGALLDIKVTDGRGFELYSGHDVASPFVLSIPGEDIHPDATELRIQVAFGRGFMPSAQDFTMRSAFTLYFGATKAEMYGVVP